jgi:predicted DCC family thiol-disulfide oxidoreductase YuxK
MDVEHLIVFYDGTCPFCVSSVKFLLDRDGRDRLRFASLESDWSNRFFAEQNLKHPGMDSLVVWDKGFLKRQSGAAIALAEVLPGIWSLGRHFDIFPTGFRDNAYDLIARNRHKWFGRYDKCWIPKPDDRRKFLDLATTAVHDSQDGDQPGNVSRPE